MISFRDIVSFIINCIEQKDFLKKVFDYIKIHFRFSREIIIIESSNYSKYYVYQNIENNEIQEMILNKPHILKDKIYIKTYNNIVDSKCCVYEEIYFANYHDEFQIFKNQTHPIIIIPKTVWFGIPFLNKNIQYRMYGIRGKNLEIKCDYNEQNKSIIFKYLYHTSSDAIKKAAKTPIFIINKSYK